MVDCAEKVVQYKMLYIQMLLLYYCVLSITVTICNKIILVYTNASFLVLFGQSVIILALLYMSSYAKLISYRSIDYKHAKGWIPIIILLVVSIYSNNKSLQNLPISHFNIIKGFGIVLVAIGDGILFQYNDLGKIMRETYLLVAIITLSNVILIKEDFMLLKSEGFKWSIINCVTCSLYTLCTKHHRLQYPYITNIDYVYYNTVLSIPVLLAFSLFENNINFTAHFTIELSSLLIISSVLTFLLTYVISMISEQKLTVKYTVVSCLNKIPMNIVSMLIFSDESFTMRHVFSMSCATVGVYLIS